MSLYNCCLLHVLFQPTIQLFPLICLSELSLWLLPPAVADCELYKSLPDVVSYESYILQMTSLK